MEDRFLMCEPTYFEIDYEINAWMNKSNKVDIKEACRQWDKLSERIYDLASVEFISPEPYPDMVFTANGGFVFGQKVVLSKFKHEERKGEEEFFKKWFEDDGYTVHEVNHYFEGAGDAFIVENRLYAGYGFRSQSLVYDEIMSLVDVDQLVLCPLADHYFYHLDTCFCPLRGNDVLWYPGAFDIDHKSSHPITTHLNTIAVPEDEARRFACNAVLVNEEHVLLPAGCPQTIDKLRQLNYTPHEFEMSEFIKSGGACKCLTLKV